MAWEDELAELAVTVKGSYRFRPMNHGVGVQCETCARDIVTDEVSFNTALAEVLEHDRDNHRRK